MSNKTDPACRAGAAAAPRPVRNHWTAKRKALFVETLAETANVRKAAAKAGMSYMAAYDLKRRDPAFRRAWREALDVGVAEVELGLIRQSLEGSEITETVLEGEEQTLKYVKTTRKIDFGVAQRLVKAHHDEVAAHRQALDDAGSEEDAAERARRHLETIDKHLAEVAARRTEGARETEA